MRTIKTALILVLICIAQIHLNAQSWNYNHNRIAISADGNNQPDNLHFWPTADPDDWGATPASLAIIAKLKLQDQLVHFSYNNFIASPPHTSATNHMKLAADGAISFWNYDSSRFFDVSSANEPAINHLAAEIVKSTDEDPLYFIHMGPSEFFYRTIVKVIEDGHIEALSHVYIVSHSGYNDNHLRRGDTKFDKKPMPVQVKHHTMQETIDLSEGRLHYKKIKDQNAKWDASKLWNSESDWTVWEWMTSHKDESVVWISERMKNHPKGYADFSDAGMVYWLLLGDEDGSPEKFKAFIGEGIL